MKWKWFFFFLKSSPMGLSKHLTINFQHSLSAAKKKKKKGRWGVIFSNADDSEPNCHHYTTLEETALHIALPCASIIPTLGINEWVNGLQKSFNLCHCELRRSNGFCFSRRPDKAFPFSPSEKSNYRLISLNGSSEPIFQNIWWKHFWHPSHDSCVIVAWKSTSWE